MPFVPPVDVLNHGHATLWGNLGDWSDTSEYVQAAAALARRLGEAANLGPGHHVVDLGSGGGDQLRMWVETFGVERVTAVELDPGLADRAAARVTAWGLEGSVRLLVGDGPTVPWADSAVDRVVALDSAYFFAPRRVFLRRCGLALRPGGVLAVTDLLLGEGLPARMAPLLAPLFGIPRDALVVEARYRSMLAEEGFADIQVHDCTEDVLGGFSRWVRTGGSRAPALTSHPALSVTGRAAGILAGAGGLRYVVLAARRRSL